MIYATASKGFRPGGANNVSGLPINLVSYKPDSLWNYEVGVKTGWFDNQLTFNAAIYQIDWNNMQTAARTADNLYSFIPTRARRAFAVVRWKSRLPRSPGSN